MRYIRETNIRNGVKEIKTEHFKKRKIDRSC